MKVTVEYLTIPRQGEQENGDAALVRHAEEGVLIVVLDALGHGAMAAQAANVGMRYLADAPLGRGLRPVIDGLHERLRGTRGAAAMLLLLHNNRLEGCGVGNVTLRSYRARVPAILTPGVLGGSLTRLRLFVGEVSPGDRLILFSDGISTRFEEEGKPFAPALATCQAIMEHHRKPHDDATVLVTDIEPVPAVGSPHAPDEAVMSMELKRLPIIKLWDRIVVPIQGEITDELAGHLSQEILREIHVSGAHGLVLDLTGVWIMDSHLCSVLSNLASAARLMGTPTIISGLSPEIAMTLQTMGVELESVQTALSLEQALAKLGLDVHRAEEEEEREGDRALWNDDDTNERPRARDDAHGRGPRGGGPGDPGDAPRRRLRFADT